MSATEILPNLWISGIVDIRNGMFYTNNNIKCVINCSKDLPFYSCNTLNIRLPVNDNLKKNEIQNLYKYMDKATNIIHSHFKKNQAVVVHCYAGKQRSASIIVAYLIKYGNMSIQDAINSIKSKRIYVFTPCNNFIDAIKKFKKNLKE